MIKFLHTRVRVADPAASIEFYQKLGFELGDQNSPTLPTTKSRFPKI
ncbi:VOC family protein [Akkermansiaceae bacterium]|nr:VOC family protein [Akkermansiaceae bacterium]